jgi:hypothetical protein
VPIVPEFAFTLNEAKARLSMLQQFVKEMMIKGVDYGLIPKCDKPSLFKSGAEKLSDVYGFSKQFEVINRIEDWTNGIFHYEIKSILISKNTGQVEAEGIGSCNNKERKYKSSDPFTIVNTILKMAKKRAFIDAVLSATRSSAFFTQDIEDYEDISSLKPVNKRQLSEIFTIVSNKKIPIEFIKSELVARFKVAESKLLNDKQANELIDYLNNYKIGALHV